MSGSSETSGIENSTFDRDGVGVFVGMREDYAPFGYGTVYNIFSEKYNIGSVRLHIPDSISFSAVMSPFERV